MEKDEVDYVENTILARWPFVNISSDHHFIKSILDCYLDGPAYILALLFWKKQKAEFSINRAEVCCFYRDAESLCDCSHFICVSLWFLLIAYPLIAHKGKISRCVDVERGYENSSGKNSMDWWFTAFFKSKVEVLEIWM